MTETIPVSMRMGAETTLQKINPAKRFIAYSALALSFFAAGCNFGDNSAPERLPTISSIEADDFSSRTARIGELATGVVVVRPLDGNAPTVGYTKEKALSMTEGAENAISGSTNGKVSFASPTFYGVLGLTASEIGQACKTDERGAPDDKFRTSVLKSARSLAATNGYQYQKNAGLITFLDLRCAEDMRSSANPVPMFSSESGVYIVEPPTLATSEYALPHEIGHMAGLRHANKLSYSGSPQDGNMGNNTTPIEYGNQRSVMGKTPSIYESYKQDATFNGYELYMLGAISPNEAEAINAPFSGEFNFRLQDISSPEAGTKLLRLPRYNNPNNGTYYNDYYWIELSRAPKGLDNLACPRGSGNKASDGCFYDQRLGVSIYTGNSGSQKPADTELIDLDSANPSAYGSADRSKRGQVIFRDRNTGITVRLIDINDNMGQAQISVKFTGKPLGLAMPTG